MFDRTTRGILDRAGPLAWPLMEFAQFARHHGWPCEVTSAAEGVAVRATTDRRWTYVVGDLGAAALLLRPGDQSFAALHPNLVDLALAGRAPSWRSDGVMLSWPSPLRAPALEIPAGYRQRPLVFGEAERVDAQWSHRGEGTIDLLRRCILRGPSVVTETMDREVIGWSLVLDDGAIGASWVAPEHRGRGVHAAQAARLASMLQALNRPIFRHLAASEVRGQARLIARGFREAGPLVWCGADGASVARGMDTD